MKKIIFNLTMVMFAAVFTYVVTGCTQPKSETVNTQSNADTTQQGAMEMDTASMAYSCPMHPDMKGKKGDKCSKCDMMLTKTGEAKQHEHGH